MVIVKFSCLVHADGWTDGQKDRRTDRRTMVKQYAPDLSMSGHKHISLNHTNLKATADKI